MKPRYYIVTLLECDNRSTSHFVMALFHSLEKAQEYCRQEMKGDAEWLVKNADSNESDIEQRETTHIFTTYDGCGAYREYEIVDREFSDEG